MVVKAADIMGAERAKIANDAQTFADGQSVGDRPSNPDAQWGEDKAVFGAYGADATLAVFPEPGPASNTDGFDPANAPLSPDAIVVSSDNQLPPKPAPYISDRELVIEVK